MPQCPLQKPVSEPGAVTGITCSKVTSSGEGVGTAPLRVQQSRSAQDPRRAQPTLHMPWCTLMAAASHGDPRHSVARMDVRAASRGWFRFHTWFTGDTVVTWPRSVVGAWPAVSGEVFSDTSSTLALVRIPST